MKGLAVISVRFRECWVYTIKSYYYVYDFVVICTIVCYCQCKHFVRILVFVYTKHNYWLCADYLLCTHPTDLGYSFIKTDSVLRTK